MGLDTYAIIFVDGESKVAPHDHFRDKDIRLIGGMFSGNGDCASFRGKCYDDYVERVTGETLYQHEIDAETVQEMAVALRKAVESGGSPTEYDDDDEQGTRESLARWFEVCAEHGYSVTGWW